MFTKSLPKGAIAAISILMTVFVGALDYVSGRDFELTAFYLIPICWAGWRLGLKAGIFMGVGCVVAWFVADMESGIVYRHPLTPYWNALMLLVLFLVVAWLLSAFQGAHYHLEETVRKRTAALQAEVEERKRLEMAKVQAQRLAALGTMAAQVAHEVRNPLGSMTLNLDLLQREIDRLAAASGQSNQEGHELLTEMRAEIQRIQRVVGDYLQFARLPKLERQPLAVNEFLAKKLEFLAGEFAIKKIKLRTLFDPSLTTLHADGEQIWQALLNLIRNSLEAMPEGGELSIGTWRESGQVRLRVVDTGKGMNPEQLEVVFSPFFTTKPQGTGLGLSLVQQIATEHGGHVECESTTGKGSVFTIVLPMAEKA